MKKRTIKEVLKSAMGGRGGIACEHSYNQYNISPKNGNSKCNQQNLKPWAHYVLKYPLEH